MLKDTMDKLTGKLLYLLIIFIFIIEFSAALSIAHLDAIHECQASNCVMAKNTTK